MDLHRWTEGSLHGYLLRQKAAQRKVHKPSNVGYQLPALVSRFMLFRAEQKKTPSLEVKAGIGNISVRAREEI